MIIIYFVLLASGLGYSDGLGAGVGGEYRSGPWALYGQAEYSAQDKLDIEADRFGALLEGRYGRKLFALAGISGSRTNTPKWTKTAWRPIVGGGLRKGSWQGVVRAYLPDSSINELHGVRVQLEYRRKLYLRARLGFWRFDSDRTDQTASLAIGWGWS